MFDTVLVTMSKNPRASLAGLFFPIYQVVPKDSSFLSSFLLMRMTACLSEEQLLAIIKSEYHIVVFMYPHVSWWYTSLGTFELVTFVPLHRNIKKRKCKYRSPSNICNLHESHWCNDVISLYIKSWWVLGFCITGVDSNRSIDSCP